MQNPMTSALVTPSKSTSMDWPALPWADWHETATTLQLWTQVIGKIRLALAPRVNHWWHIPLYVTCQGLTTSPMPYGSRMLQIDFDFLNHQLVFQTSDGLRETIALVPMTVSSFYRAVMAQLEALGFHIAIWTMPVEMADPIPFEKDDVHAAYDAEAAMRFWRVLVQVDRMLSLFRAGFIGKVSPVHFFWGSFDMAVTRFSGRVAPQHPGGIPHLADSVTQTAYSHEVSSCGFWPGGPGCEQPVFYAYAYPAPTGFAQAAIQPETAFFNTQMGEFMLPYDAVRQLPDPDAAILAFLQTTYEAAANAGHWERDLLEPRSRFI